MNWLTNYVLPKIRALTRKDVPDNLWKKCPACEQMLFHRELAANLEVCRHCGHHFRIGSEARCKLLFDDGAFAQIAPPRVQVDPLHFRDRKRYSERLREGQAALGAGSDPVALAEGRIGGVAAGGAGLAFRLIGGSMGGAGGGGGIAPPRRAGEHAPGPAGGPASRG